MLLVPVASCGSFSGLVAQPERFLGFLREVLRIVEEVEGGAPAGNGAALGAVEVPLAVGIPAMFGFLFGMDTSPDLAAGWVVVE